MDKKVIIVRIKECSFPYWYKTIIGKPFSVTTSEKKDFYKVMHRDLFILKKDCEIQKSYFDDSFFKRRSDILISMGFEYGGASFTLKDVWSCYHEQVYDFSDYEFEEYLKDIKEAIERKK